MTTIARRSTEQLNRVLMGASSGAHLPVRLAGGPVEISATLYVSPTAEDATGAAASGLMLHFIDTTEQKNLEIRFAQSQKMQAMGQLAGGVAHDFNNLLTAMIGFCDLLLQRHGPGDASFADIMQIKQNANRAASLVRQLLAFSRRQTLQPRLFDITDALADLSTLLRRLMGEIDRIVGDSWPRSGACAGRSGAIRPGHHQSGGQCPRRHAGRRNALDHDRAT